MAYGAKTVIVAGGVPIMGGLIPEGAVNSYSDGAAAPVADLIAAAAALPGPAGLNSDQVKFLVSARMGMGLTWAQAKAALLAASSPDPPDAVLEAWKPRIDAILVMNPPLYSDVQAHAIGPAGSILDFSNPQETGLLGERLGM